MSDLIARHLAALRAKGLSENTVHDRKRLLKALDRDLPHGVDQAATEELQEWLGREGLAAKTRETYWCHIVGFYRWAARGRTPRLDWDPSEELDRPVPGRHHPRVAADDQLHQCLLRLGHPVRLAVVLAAGLGMRCAEISRVAREHFDGHRVLIRGKGDKERSVPVPADVWEEVEPLPPGLLVVNRWGQAMSADAVGQACASALDAVGFPTLTIHWFRGAYATRLRRSGVDLSVISRLLGHSSVATTQRYLELTEADLDQAIAHMPTLMQSSWRAPRPVEPEPASNRLGPTAEAA